MSCQEVRNKELAFFPLREMVALSELLGGGQDRDGPRGQALMRSRPAIRSSRRLNGPRSKPSSPSRWEPEPRQVPGPASCASACRDCSNRANGTPDRVPSIASPREAGYQLLTPRTTVNWLGRRSDHGQGKARSINNVACGQSAPLTRCPASPRRSAGGPGRRGHTATLSTRRSSCRIRREA